MTESRWMDMEFYRGKRVLVTGHTGFKGTWLCRILAAAGAQVTGYGLVPTEEQRLFALSKVEEQIHSVIGDIRDLDHLKQVFEEVQPELVFHLAAQPLVRVSYEEPVYTYETNVMGTVHVCECVRLNPCVKSFLNVTTDKVYENKEWVWGYRETDALDGYDPYSNSKSCSELVSHSYAKGFLAAAGTAVSTARAGNVIGGGDFSRDRIIPDCVRAAKQGRPVVLRNPHAVRPFQHVLEPLFAYLMLAERQYQDPGLADSYNVGPEEQDCVTTGQLAEEFCRAWGEGMCWRTESDGGPHEAGLLRLDCSLLKSRLGWRPHWGICEAVEKTVEWYKCWMAGKDVAACMDRQIQSYLGAGE